MLMNEGTKQTTNTAGLLTMTLKDSFGSRKSDSSLTAFKDVFGSAVGRDSSSGSTCAVQAGRQDSVRDADDRKIKSFRDLQRSIRSDVRKNVVKERSDSVDRNEEEKTDKKQSVDREACDNAILGCFAGLTGMNPEEFKGLLEKAGISAEQLSGMTDMKDIAGKIAAAAGLSDGEKDTLTKMMNLAAEKISAALGKESALLTKGVNQQNSASENPGEQNPNGAIAVTNLTDNTEAQARAMLSAAAAKLKQKLDEMGKKLNTEGAGAVEALNAEIDGLLGNLKESVQGSGFSSNAGQNPQADDSAREKAQDQYENLVMQNVKEKRAETGKTAVTEARPAAEAVEGSTGTAAATDSEAVNPAAFVQTLKNDVKMVNEKAGIKTPAETKEILNQVIEKAKVVITPDKSEMVMDLKPDSLGKLSLKVVTEQGIVMAKFVAENEQVKQILEANMQLLKDSLEKQGMGVQGFSVSVRQDSGSSAGRWYNGGAEGRSRMENGLSGIRRSGGTVAAEASMVNLSRNNPYNWGGSTINITA